VRPRIAAWVAFRVAFWGTLWSTSWATLGIAGAARAGPPLVSDDPGTADARTLQAITAFIGRHRSSGTWYQTPLLDLAYGLTERLELDLLVPWYVVDTPDGGWNTGFGSVSPGVKWRFWESADGSMRLAAVPTFTFETAANDVDRGPAQASFGIGLPILGDVAFGDAQLGGNVSYQLQPGDRDSWFGAVYLAWTGFDRLQPVAEVTTTTDRNLGNGDWTFNVGFDATLTERVHALVAGGRGLHSGTGDLLDWRVYAGIQVILGPWSPRSEAAKRPQRARSTLQMPEPRAARNRNTKQ
jgi:hypothetical protein